MKELFVVLTLVGLFLFSGVAISQEMGKMPEKHAQMMEMMKDSTMMKQMMEHIAADDHMRKMMMHKMMASAKGDSAKMMGMCKMMMEDHDMHGMMEKMMGGEMMGSGMSGMMKGDMQAAEKAAPEVIVKFKPEAAEAEIKDMESESGLEKVKEIPGLRMKVYRITSTKSVEEVIETCQKHTFVEYAEANQEYRTMNTKSSGEKKDDHQKHHQN